MKLYEATYYISHKNLNTPEFTNPTSKNPAWGINSTENQNTHKLKVLKCIKKID